MLKFQCLLSVLKRSYICYYIIRMAVPLKVNKVFKNQQKKSDCLMKNVN